MLCKNRQETKFYCFIEILLFYCSEAVLNRPSGGSKPILQQPFDGSEPALAS